MMRVTDMKKCLLLTLFVLLGVVCNANAQMAALNKAKYVATLKVVADHKVNDKDIVDDVRQLNEHKKFKQDLAKMLKKLDNSNPNGAKNQKIMRILERAGRDIYNELN